MSEDAASAASNTMCVVCQGDLSAHGGSHTLACGHVFHTDCIMQWFRSLQSRCPLCLNAGGVELNNHAEEHGYYRAIDSTFRSEVKAYVRQNPDVPGWLKRLLLRERAARLNEQVARRHHQEVQRQHVPRGMSYKEAFKAVRLAKSKIRHYEWERTRLWRLIRDRVNLVPLTIIQRRRRAAVPPAAAPEEQQPQRRASARLAAASRV